MEGYPPKHIEPLTNHELDNVNRFVEEAAIPFENRGQCKNLKCLRVLDIPHSNTHNTNAHECPWCGEKMCRKCKQKYHPPVSCEAAQRSLASDEASMALINATTKPCPHCQFRVSHYHGHACHHIQPGGGCPSCHKHFCYVCLGKSREEKNLY